MAWPEADGGADGGAAQISLYEPQYGIATGQAAVLYDAENPEVVLGGGWITAAPTPVPV